MDQTSTQRKIAALQAKLAQNSGASENEKTIAKNILEAFRIAGHDIDIDKLEFREFNFRGGPRNKEKADFLQIILFNTIGWDKLKGRKLINDYAYNFEMELTLSEFIEARERFEFYWRHYQKEKTKAEAIFLRAYVQKNQLWSKPYEKEEDEPPRVYTPQELEEQRRVRAMQEGIDRAEYSARIEAPKP